MNSSAASLLLRVAISSMMLTHGWPKFQKILAGDWGFGNPIGLGAELSLVLAVFAEFFCSILLIVGFKSRLAAIPPAITMIVAAFIIHADDLWKKQEFPLLYLTAYLAIILLGSGRYSLDAKLQQR